jgi:SsrA-binding protein
MSLIENRKAKFNYELMEKYEAGIELVGSEVKMLRKGQGSLEGAYVVIRGGEAYITNMTIPPYQPKNMPDGYDPVRNRRLLLSKKDIGTLAGVDGKKGLTIVPISVYNKKRFLKVEIAVARGKRQFDKRETIKRRESDRDIERTLKDQY